MLTSQENMQRFYDFHNYQTNRKKESLSICESIALWLSPPVPEGVKEKKKKHAKMTENNHCGV
jgi:hypothetical protein